MIELEGNDGITGRRGQLASVGRPKDDLLVVQDVVDRLHGRQGAIGKDDTADDVAGEQPQALAPGQLDQLSAAPRVRRLPDPANPAGGPTAATSAHGRYPAS
jgi:hypothetical protein